MHSKLNLKRIRIILALTTISEMLYWFYRNFHIPIINYISFALTMVVILQAYFLMTSSQFKYLISQTSFADKIFKILLMSSIVISVISLFTNLKDFITVLFNPYTFPAIVLFLVGYLVGKYIFITASERWLIKVARSIMILNIVLFLLGVAVKSFSFAAFDAISRTMYVAMVYFLVRPLKRDLWLLVPNLIIFFLASVFSDVRSNLLVLGLTFFFALFHKSILVSRFSKLMFIVGIAFAVLLIFNSESFLDTLLNLPIIDGFNVSKTDTRTFLYDEFLTSFQSIPDFLLGRGLMGAYFSDYFYNLYGTENQGDYYMRFTIEVGVLEVILKYGFIFLILYSAIIITTIFKSRRTELIAYVVFILYVLMFIEFFPAFSIRYLMFWILIGYLNSKLNAVNVSLRKNILTAARVNHILYGT